MFTAALFAIVNLCPLMDEWIKEVMVYVYIYVCVCVCVCVYSGILFSHKKEKILPFVTTWMESGH